MPADSEKVIFDAPFRLPSLVLGQRAWAQNTQELQGMHVQQWQS